MIFYIIALLFLLREGFLICSHIKKPWLSIINVHETIKEVANKHSKKNGFFTWRYRTEESR